MPEYSDQPERLRRPPIMPAAGVPDVPPPPRTLTARALRQSWHEPAVRFACIVLLGLLLIAGWYAAVQILEFRSEQRLIDKGVAVDAVIIHAVDDRKGHTVSRDNDATLQFTLDGQTVNVTGLLNTTSDYITVGDHVPLHVNPHNPSEWTDRAEPLPLGRRMIAGFIIVPVALAAALAALLLRRRALKIWTTAPALPYNVVDTRHSALAPHSHVVRCVSASRGDGVIVSVYLPARFPKPNPGDLLWLLHHPGKPRSAIAAPAYL